MTAPIEISRILRNIGSELSLQLAISMGQLPGWTYVRKYGTNEQIIPSTEPEDVWDGGGIYVWDSVASPIYASSSVDTDTVEMVLEGLDDNWNFQQRRVTLNGQTAVQVPGNWIRVNRAYNDDNARHAGDVYFYRSSVPVAGIPPIENLRLKVKSSAQQSLHALYTIPARHVGFFLSGSVGIRGVGSPSSNGEHMNCHLETRRLGKVFRIAQSIDLTVGSDTIYKNVLDIPEHIPGQSDIRTLGHTVTAELGIWAAFSVLMIEEEQFPADFLAAIGQTGYM